MGGSASSEDKSSHVAAAVEVKTEESSEKKPCKPCCACPETKRVRDACIVEEGEENCKSLIEAHRECMKKLGFNI